jgi:RimJ/RimL family protein N-acetyltransferase
VLAQFLVVRSDTGEPVGLVACYNADFRHSYAYLAMIVAPQYEANGWPLEAAGVFLTYIFETFGFHKVYMESVEFNYRQLASGAGSLFHVEGCLRDHEYHLGQRWHQYTLAIYAQEWTETVGRLAPDLVPRTDRVQP